MPTFSNWAGGEGQPDAIAQLISFKPTTTSAITRGSGTVNAKAGRLETLSGDRRVQGQGGMTFVCDAMLLCVYGTGFLPGDRFTVASVAYEVVMILPGHTDCEQVMLQLRR